MGKGDDPRAGQHGPAVTIQSFLKEIDAARSRGDNEGALEIAGKALRRFPDSTALYNSAGVCAAVAGKTSRAEEYWRRAIELDPGNAQTFYNLGLLRERQHIPAEAEKYYRQSLDLQPDNVDALSNLGVLLAALGRLDEAEQCYRKALAVDPDRATVHANLGVLLADSERNTEAAQCYSAALARRPDDAKTWANLGALLARTGNVADAERCYRKAIEIEPQAAAFSNLGVVLAGMERFEEAEECYRKAIALDPARADAYSNLGLLLERLHRDDEADAAYRSALKVQAKAEILNNLANLLTRHRKTEEAERLYRQAIGSDPDSALSYCSLGVLLSDEERVEEAEDCFRRALQRKPEYPLANFNLSLLLLKQGRFAEGWRRHEARYHPSLSNQGRFLFPVKAASPQWRGESLQGKSLLVWPEQGAGDEIQFCRYITVLKRAGAKKITVICPPSLTALLETLKGIDQIIPATADTTNIPPHDYWSYLLSIPLYCRTEENTIPAEVPYLRVPVKRNRLLVESSAKRLRVGLVWKGNPNHHNDAYRSLPSLAALAPLWSVPGISFVSLQKGPAESEAASPPKGQPLINEGPSLHDFADTAAVIDQIDLLISVDTAVAHLAGAMGKPCWVLLPSHRTDWRWMNDRTDSPWYPGVMRLFRQDRGERWDPVLEKVRKALQAF